MSAEREAAARASAYISAAEQLGGIAATAKSLADSMRPLDSALAPIAGEVSNAIAGTSSNADQQMIAIIEAAKEAVRLAQNRLELAHKRAVDAQLVARRKAREGGMQ